MSRQCDGCPHKSCIGWIHCDSPAKGEIAAEFTLADGTQVVVMDAAYRNKTPEQLQMIRENSERIALEIMTKAALLRMQEA